MRTEAQDTLAGAEAPVREGLSRTESWGVVGRGEEDRMGWACEGRVPQVAAAEGPRKPGHRAHSRKASQNLQPLL